MTPGTARRWAEPTALTHPSGGIARGVAAAITATSTNAFHLAMLVAAGLLVAGAPVSFVGLRESQPARAVGRLHPMADVA